MKDGPQGYPCCALLWAGECNSYVLDFDPVPELLALGVATCHEKIHQVPAELRTAEMRCLFPEIFGKTLQRPSGPAGIETTSRVLEEPADTSFFGSQGPIKQLAEQKEESRSDNDEDGFLHHAIHG